MWFDVGLMLGLMPFDRMLSVASYARRTERLFCSAFGVPHRPVLFRCLAHVPVRAVCR
jgi:hypothetical protein